MFFYLSSPYHNQQNSSLLTIKNAFKNLKRFFQWLWNEPMVYNRLIYSFNIWSSFSDIFLTKFRHRGGYLATTTRTNTLFLFYQMQQNRTDRFPLYKNEVGRSVSPFFYNCWESCSLLRPRDLRNTDDLFSV